MTVTGIVGFFAEGAEEVVNTEVNLKVQSLSLILNQSQYELAKATVSEFRTHVSARDGTTRMTGTLGSMSLRDQSPHGRRYTDRFVTTGDHALDFDFFK